MDKITRILILILILSLVGCTTTPTQEASPTQSTTEVVKTTKSTYLPIVFSTRSVGCIITNAEIAGTNYSTVRSNQDCGCLLTEYDDVEGRHNIYFIRPVTDAGVGVPSGTYQTSASESLCDEMAAEFQQLTVSVPAASGSK
ncbi:hypothetical protein A2334_03360 [Candidatus Roizmanbacteria bacterium RIFOXYB2_FULL_38_10]|uniref:Uncharacterized protein n=1 Tax=Candidatus Roizmanbacteria bacterium RIFOXYD1_FULL_38_12 TaxID=1802093 RepID=A0A1F7L130_9BACT|nr:MAG: hypothetical protein A3K47_03485 [Candidatus Roizmanbacteria bacterium RIFOXYA2_FULL_38_14]OGK63825.1 MAG: hypothetical protein A3K27_03485 [Candidatus Roizmanbacteria bacterium RIFOXYA1_FULL_37_12]OGK65671.1 MAG: hypothetical protein A3K38_03485 [Candidatus Roizmanbacteria bacterium RIFOXYB1_FULL_40_23]OGK67441.1 MAG: hypothetical protein A2334_03360 [Candidatus Roizmanbacteria bacterium RIFOXYB2_FULL_38_10]OGK70076.1 MAG: hypothetical protein A3K21_03490 [Candidatus Roizmanbacteria ba